MPSAKTTFAVMYGNRTFFPKSLIASAREELPRVLREMGHDSIMLDDSATPWGAVETTREGEVFARFLAENKGRFGGVIVSLPNFGDETGAVAALKDAGVPIFIQAYPDDMDKLAPDTRRDAFCGKLSIMDVLAQYGVPFTVMKPHVVPPDSAAFRRNIADFDAICRVVGGVRGMTVGSIGARTTPFKTVRIDELALQKHGVTVETVDMASVIARVKAAPAKGKAFQAKAKRFKAVSRWDAVPSDRFENIVKLAVVLDALADEMQLDAMAVRCWTELQQELGVSPCVVMGVMGEDGRPAACEVDLGNAVMMQALRLAADAPATLLDWNNNYGDAEDKCILFHCGPVPPSLMAGKGEVIDHEILKNALGSGCSYGCNVGRIRPMDFTFGSLLTQDGSVKCFLGEGAFTTDPIPSEFFGCAGVAQIRRLEDVLYYMARTGHRHHVTVAPGLRMNAVNEALGRYLGFEVALPQQGAAQPLQHEGILTGANA